MLRCHFVMVTEKVIKDQSYAIENKKISIFRVFGFKCESDELALLAKLIEIEASKYV